MLDFFQKPLPMFNIKGRSTVPSLSGGLISLLIIIVIGLYSAVKFKHMAEKQNPSISSFIEYGALHSDFELNFKDIGIYFAFSIEGFMNKDIKYDPRYVKGFARLMTRD